MVSTGGLTQPERSPCTHMFMFKQCPFSAAKNHMVWDLRLGNTEPIGYNDTGYSDKLAAVTVLTIPKLCIC